MKLSLGTAQFGTPYGITNTRGQLALAEVQESLDLFCKAGGNLLDTSPTYGNAEEILGGFSLGALDVVTKLPKITDPTSSFDAEKWVIESAETSAKNLNVPSLHGFLLRETSDLWGPHGKKILKALSRIKDANLVKNIGISVYHTEEVKNASNFVSLDIIEAPVNILDQRFAYDSFTQSLRTTGTKLLARSVFFQGLLLLAPEKWPSFFSQTKLLYKNFCEELKTMGLSPLEGNLLFAEQTDRIDQYIVGIDSPTQLQEILAIQKKILSFSKIPEHWRKYAVLEPIDEIIPYRWPSFDPKEVTR